ncbi:MAG: hypothetical protein GY775_02665 [Candidatus Scalindua sp.]|nr:hypothetical protein [Candidatus Scalindua sp.]
MKTRISIFPKLLFIFLFFTLLCSCKEVTMANQKISFTHLQNVNLQSEVIPQQKIVFADKKSWNKFWEQFGIGNIPEVDFAHNMIAAIFLGQKPNLGYGVEIINFEKKHNKLLIRFVEYLPNPQFDYPAAIGFPYDIVIFTRTDGEILFEGVKTVK